MKHNCTCCSVVVSDLLLGTVLPPKNYEHKNHSYLPFLRRGQRSVQSNDPSPSKPTLGFCLLLSQNRDETSAVWVLLVMGHAEDGSTAPSWLPLGEIQTWEKPLLKSRIQLRIVEEKVCLAIYSVLKGYCPYVPNMSVLSPREHNICPEELWANV